MFDINSFFKEYDTESVRLEIQNRNLEILVPKTIDRFLDPANLMQDFPLWAKIWSASVVLAEHLAAMEVNRQETFLEIGAGLGVVGIAAAACGHRITLTEYNPDALNFARANACLNNCRDLPVHELDWNRPLLFDTFDYIVGSEVAYREEDLDPLIRLFRKLLKPGGEVILAGEMRQISKAAYKKLDGEFDLRVQKKVLRLQDEETPIFLFRMRVRD